MIQTLALVFLLLTGAAFVQANMPAMNTPIPLIVPGMTDINLTYLDLLVALGGMLVLLWVAGLIDLAVQRARVRRRDATILAKDQEIMRMKAVAYDHQEPALADLTGRLEGIAQEIRSLLVRLESTMSGGADRIVRREVTPDSAGRTVREEVTAVHSEG